MVITANPGIFEVDLVFPRNATYTPQALSPIVWALQNPSLALPITASITWNLWEGNSRSSPGSVAGGLFELTEEITSSEPFLLSDFVNTMAYPEGQWTLTWDLEFYNCSALNVDNYNVVTRGGSTVFTIDKSGQEPDLVAATSDAECGAMGAVALNITALDDICGHLGPTPTSNPCGVTINSTTNASLYASATAYACSALAPENANVTCPTSSSSASNSAGRSRMAAAPVLLMLLATVTNLVYLG
ncbi:hypothetical protein N7466_000163 [Penicillium verhagenii]|uniref:uncharacterized protein n=1 Tax=Penicillium verhagenii TaxID=1562060 RepID=UPI002544F6BC|nr:uncharacterized protein N7466_000163 [Penicillium verhagenii]KAJ5947148.1 hypothetical protein N7466_000163 [Penicillium verhagenii]